jgi:putative phosphoribosyl transferase
VTGEEQPVRIPVGDVELDGDLAHGIGARALVLFAHGSGSSRHSPRNRFVAGALREGGLSTLLVDLLSPAEEEEDLRTRRLRFDIELLAARLAHITTWLRAQPPTSKQPIGLFGASTGGGAALVAAARLPDDVGAVVSRGGRPDLAGPALRSVRAPTLLLVGGLDTQVIELNRQALGELTCPKELEIVAGASHLFEEQGALEQVAARARKWFVTHLVEGAAQTT